MATLLPKVSSDFEIKMSELADRYSVGIDSKILWNPEECPEELLIYLAWALSVDRWNDEWSEDTKRRVCRDSLDIHRMKGTTKSLKMAVDSIGYGISIEMWTENHKLKKGTFRARVKTDKPIYNGFYDDMEAIINENKRGSLHLDGFDTATSSKCTPHITSLFLYGETVRISPLNLEDCFIKDDLNYGAILISREKVTTLPI